MSRDRWPGGYIHRQADGRPLFVIEKKIKKKKFHISTRAHSLRAAMKHLERFETDPANYHPEGVREEEGLLLTQNLADAFYEWQRARGTTRKHAKEVGHRLAAWMTDLAGVDLRKMTLRDHVVPALDRRETMRGARISTLKAFMGWLRKERHLLTSADDCTLDLPVPQAVPEKRRRRKAVSLEVLRAVLPELAKIGEPYADAMILRIATGWHWTELARFIKSPESEIIRAQREDTIAVLSVLHKRGEVVRFPVKDPEVLAAAERLRQRGRVPKKHNKALADACVAAKVPVFKWGVVRHTAGTLFVEMGASALAASELLGHKDKRTFDKFYSDVVVPTTTVQTPKLRVMKG